MNRLPIVLSAAAVVGSTPVDQAAARPEVEANAS